MLMNLLVPLDGSLLAECVLAHAVAIAKAFNAQITLLNVLEQPIESFGRPKADPLDWYLQKTAANTYLDVVKTRLEKSDVSVKAVLLEGRAIEKIIEMAHSSDVDLLILSSHGRPDVNGWSVSGIVQQVVQRTRTSTLIIPESQSNSAQLGDLIYRRLLVPLDGSRRAGSALPLATALVQAHQGELTLVHVVSKPEMARHMPLTPEDAELINRFVERNQEEGNRYLEQLREQLPTTVQTHLLVSDNVAATIQSFSEQEQIDLLILSAHGYSGEAKWPYGSVTNRFITNGTVPLLIVQDLPHESSETTRDEVFSRQLAH
jgi:nucleotide-binding universal stress UspA family protein